MSKVAVKGNDSGTGVFTLEAPNSNSDRTLNLPDDSGELLLSSSLDFASDADVRDGSSTNKIVTPSNIDNTILGMGQSYQNVTGSRSRNIDYTNTTGRPIVVIAWNGASNTSREFRGYIDNSLIARSRIQSQYTFYTFITFIVPNNSIYRIEGSNPDEWVELR